MNIIKLKKATKIYGKNASRVTALNRVNLEIEKGEFIAIMGTSGAGKSTILNIVGCLDVLTEGDYFLDGKSIEECSRKELAKIRNEKFGFVVQDFALIERYTVKKNILLPLSYSSKKIPKNNLDILLDKFGISDKKDVMASNLSGGQRQRVSIARALINEPDIILADEPTGALDKKTGDEIISILSELNKEGKTIIIVTHDKDIASQCSRIIQIEDGEI